MIKIKSLFKCVVDSLIIYGLFSILLLGSILPVGLHGCALSVFLSNGNWKEIKTSGAW